MPDSLRVQASPAKAKAEFDAVVDQTVQTVQSCAAAGLVLGGGGLATAVLSKLGCTTLNIQLEVDRNTPLCRVRLSCVYSLRTRLQPPLRLLAKLTRQHNRLGPMSSNVVQRRPIRLGLTCH